MPCTAAPPATRSSSRSSCGCSSAERGRRTGAWPRRPCRPACATWSAGGSSGSPMTRGPCSASPRSPAPPSASTCWPRRAASAPTPRSMRSSRRSSSAWSRRPGRPATRCASPTPSWPRRSPRTSRRSAGAAARPHRRRHRDRPRRRPRRHLASLAHHHGQAAAMGHAAAATRFAVLAARQAERRGRGLRGGPALGLGRRRGRARPGRHPRGPAGPRARGRRSRSGAVATGTRDKVVEAIDRAEALGDTGQHGPGRPRR